MSESGLLVPEHDLTAAEFKDLARRMGRAAFVPLFLRLYQRAMSSESTIEEQRKVLADISRWVGVEEERKVDPNANLPVFNIIFGSSAQGQPSVQAIDITPPEPSPQKTPNEKSLDAQDKLLDGILPLVPPEMMVSLAQEMQVMVQAATTPEQEKENAQLQALQSADAALADAAPVEQIERPADSPDQSAGSEPPVAEKLPRSRQRSRQRGLRLATGAEAISVPATGLAVQVPDGVPKLGLQQVQQEEVMDTFHDALAGLDSLLGI